MKIESLTLQKYPFYVGVDKLINQLTAAATIPDRIPHTT